MNWKTIRLALLCLILALNIGLFGYNLYLNMERYIVPHERIEQLKEQYRKAGYVLPDTISTKQYPMKGLLLKKVDLEKRADAFWDAEYEKSYMIGSKVLYTCGTETVTVDRYNSSLTYTQNRPVYTYGLSRKEEEEIALRFACRLLNSEDLTLLSVSESKPGVYVYLFCESYKGQLVFSKGASVTVCDGAVQQASMTQYTIEGFLDEQPIYPVDEVLFSCLKELGNAETTEELTLFYGYMAQDAQRDTIHGDPYIFILQKDGEQLLVNRYTVEFGTLRY